MTLPHNSSVLMGPGSVVGTVHSPESLPAARRAAAGLVDFLELRVDHFARDPARLLAAARAFRQPLIVTVRHPAEGGQHSLTPARRRALYEQFMPFAAAIDVEIRSVRALAPTIALARKSGVRVILSFHDFQRTPSTARLTAAVRAGQAAGADVVKIATRADDPAALHRLLGLFTLKNAPMLSVMGMGQLGKVSRLLFARAGSVLNYAYLGSANASGQWSARDFKARLAEVAG